MSADRDPGRGSEPGRGGERLPHDWDASYADTPPWDIGRPQTPFVELADAGALHGRVLDLGCGTGEHALLAASRGLAATGVDLSPTAIAQARAKAAERGLEADFVVGDALDGSVVGGSFDVALDCGFFHVLADADRPRYADVLRQLLVPGGSAHLLCFSDRVPGDAGPRRIRQEELRATFAGELSVAAIDEAYIAATFTPEPVPAWLATIVRESSAGVAGRPRVRG